MGSVSGPKCIRFRWQPVSLCHETYVMYALIFPIIDFFGPTVKEFEAWLTFSILLQNSRIILATVPAIRFIFSTSSRSARSSRCCNSWKCFVTIRATCHTHLYWLSLHSDVQIIKIGQLLWPVCVVKIWKRKTHKLWHFTHAPRPPT